MKKMFLAVAAATFTYAVAAQAHVHERVSEEMGPDTVRIAYRTDGWGGTAYHETKKLPLHPDNIVVAPERADKATLCVAHYIKTKKGRRMLAAGADAKGARAAGAWILTLDLDTMRPAAEYAERGKGDFDELGFSLAEVKVTVFTECPKTLLSGSTSESVAMLQFIGTLDYVLDVVGREGIDFVDAPAPKKPKRKR